MSSERYIGELINEGYVLVAPSSNEVRDLIKDKYPEARVIELSSDIICIEDNLGVNKYVVDSFYKDHSAIRKLKENPKNLVKTFRYSPNWLIEEDVADDDDLLVIKLKDLDSVPEVYYKGEQLFGKRMLSVKYEWTTCEDATNNGKHLIEVKGFDVEGTNVNKFPSIDTIKRERVNID